MACDVIEMDPTAYEILAECKYGLEEFFVLISSIDYSDPARLQEFRNALLRLTSQGLLTPYQANRPVVTFDEAILDQYLSTRILGGENLDEPPSACNELAFATTSAGAALLKPEDRP